MLIKRISILLIELPINTGGNLFKKSKMGQQENQWGNGNQIRDALQKLDEFQESYESISTTLPSFNQLAYYTKQEIELWKRRLKLALEWEEDNFSKSDNDWNLA